MPSSCVFFCALACCLHKKELYRTSAGFIRVAKMKEIFSFFPQINFIHLFRSIKESKKLWQFAVHSLSLDSFFGRKLCSNKKRKSFLLANKKREQNVPLLGYIKCDVEFERRDNTRCV